MAFLGWRTFSVERHVAPDMTPLDKFGQFVMRNLRDRAIAQHLKLQAGEWRGPDIQELQTAVVALPEESRRLVLRCVAEAIDTATHNLLFALQEATTGSSEWRCWSMAGTSQRSATDCRASLTEKEDGSGDTVSMQTHSAPPNKSLHLTPGSECFRTGIRSRRHTYPGPAWLNSSR